MNDSGNSATNSRELSATSKLSDNKKVVLLHRFLKLTNRLMAPFSTHLSHKYRISLNEFRLLMTIGALGRTASHEVAALTGVNAMSISRAVATLQRNGRINVVRDEENKRRKWLTLTPEGERLYGAMRPQSDLVADFLFSELNEQELEDMQKIVSRLIVRLEAKDEEGRSLFLENTRV